MKFDKHIATTISKANRAIGIISRSFKCKKKHIMLPLYKSIIRPILDYCSPVWNPYLKKDIQALEKVQRRFTRMIEGFKELSYEQRLGKLHLMTLEMRRLRYDLIVTYKIMHGLEMVKREKFFKINKSNTRGNSMELYKNAVSTTQRKNFYCERIINAWNVLPDDVVKSKNVAQFKAHLTSERLGTLTSL